MHLYFIVFQNTYLLSGLVSTNFKKTNMKRGGGGHRIGAKVCMAWYGMVWCGIVLYQLYGINSTLSRYFVQNILNNNFNYNLNEILLFFTSH